jgi:hypothetical protein
MWKRSLCALLLSGCGHPGPPGDDGDDGTAECEGAFEILGTCFEQYELPDSTHVVYRQALDVDGDGSEELIGQDSEAGTLQVIEIGSDGALTFASAPSTQFFGWSATGDVDGDGVREIVHAYDDIETFRVAADGTPTLIASDPIPGAPFGLVEDEDGIAHLLNVFNWQHHSFTWVDGHWTLDSDVESMAPGCGVNHDGVQGDFDANGTEDLAFLGVVGTCDQIPQGPSPLSIFRTIGGVIVESASEADAGHSSDLRPSVGDLDGDGADDLLIWSWGNSGRVSILWGDSESPLVVQQIVELPAGANDEGLADFDGDGIDEILYSTSVEGEEPVLHRLRDPSDSTSGQALVTLYAQGLFCDINSDGIDEIYSPTLNGTYLFVSVNQ